MITLPGVDGGELGEVGISEVDDLATASRFHEVIDAQYRSVLQR